MKTSCQSDNKKRILVTGGASGIGAVIVEKLALSGHRIAVIDCNQKAINGRFGILSSVDLVFLGDVSDSTSMDSVFNELDNHWNGLDVVINNAGVSIPASMMNTTLEIWQRTLSVNLTGVFIVSQRAASRMLNQGSGAIINIASVSGMIGMPNYLSYNVSKAGVIELTKTLALELSPSIRVNAICPGYVLTPMQEQEYTSDQLNELANSIPIKRLGKTTEIAALVAYLISEDAQFINGSSIVIDGGETAGGLASA